MIRDEMMFPHVTKPKSSAERWAWLIADAKRILAHPPDHSRGEVRWAEDMIGAAGCRYDRQTTCR
jgi:hypothetical protein